MFTKRIIPCLDVKNGRVVKGVNFVDLKDAGDPVEIAKAYDKAGADEVVFLDITASSDQRGTVVDMVRKVAANVFIPFTVGGGIRTVDDFKMLLREGADKISINSSAINNPQLIHFIFRDIGKSMAVPMVLFFLMVFLMNGDQVQLISQILPMGQLRLMALQQSNISGGQFMFSDFLWVLALCLGTYLWFRRSDLK